VIRVGLTGGIGAGKSAVARRLAELGAVIVDADLVAREVVAPGTPGLAAVVEQFGRDMLTPDGCLDRGSLGAVVFADEGRRRTLEAIVHPLVARRTGELVASAPSGAVVVHDVPLLVEKGMGSGYHLVLMVDAPAPTRVRRIIEGRGMTEQDAWARVRVQATDEQRRAAADVWLDNTGTPVQLVRAVDRLWHERLVPFAANVASRRRTPRPDAAVLLVDDDPAWPAQAERLAARVAAAVGDRGRGVEHVGSTAVPGLAAKDVIDLQLGVTDLADVDSLRTDLQDAGFPAVPGIWHDNPKPVDPDPAHWRKRLHASADPGRAVNLHVREIHGPGWRYALLIRDWLRMDAAARADYEVEKLRLAGACASTAEYAEAKEPWFDHALPRAQAWASQTGWRPE
jgi:dephospho-CoA kinase